MKKYTITPLRFLSICKWGIGLFAFIGFVCFVTIILKDEFFNFSFNINTTLASQFGDFVGGFIGTFFSIIGALLIILTLIYQTIENRKTAVTNQFFKMLEFHNENVNRLKIKHIDKTKKDEIVENRRAFVIFRLQIKKLLKDLKDIDAKLALNLSNKDLIDIVYVSFYYGIDKEWRPFLEKKLEMHSRHQEIVSELLKKKQYAKKYAIGRTNQTSLSSYFRNMYNAIKLIDSSVYLTENEKITNIKILRAQLSNPELYVLYYNIMSRFGRKWVDNKYVTKYEFITNLPFDYCDDFNPNDDFPMQYEEEELTS